MPVIHCASHLKIHTICYSVAMDLSPLNIFSLPDGMVLSWHALSVECTRETTGEKCFASNGLTQQAPAASWLLPH